MIWAWVGSEIEDIGHAIFGAGWTYYAWEIPLSWSTSPNAPKFGYDVTGIKPKFWVDFKLNPSPFDYSLVFYIQNHGIRTSPYIHALSKSPTKLTTYMIFIKP